MKPEVAAKLAGLSPYAREILLSPPRPPDPPIRAELFGLHRFEQHGRSLAQAQKVETAPRAEEFFPRVAENIEALRRAYDYIAATSRTGHYVTPAAEWLLDNFHLVEAQLQQIRDGVPRRYYAELPKLAGPHLAGLPRVYGIAWAYVAHTDSVLNAQTFRGFLRAYQEVDELRLAELWALPTTLRVVLLENLRRLADSIAQSKVAREVAHAAWDNAAALTAADLEELLETLKGRGLQRAFLTQLWQRMPAARGEDAPALADWTERHCPDGAALVTESQAAQVSANLTVSNIITTLRLIGQVEWAELIEPLSGALRELGRLPSFARESELTRKQITHAMERLARRTGKPEREIARAAAAVALEADARDSASATATASYYLIGPGYPELCARLGLAPAAGAARPPLLRHWRLALYLGTIAAGTLLLLYAAARHSPWHGALGALGAALLVLPASEAVASLVHRLLAESLKVHSLPRLDFTTGIPPEHRVLVAVPTILSSQASLGRLARRLSLHWLANRERHAQFALLTDWADAPAAEAAGDAQLLAAAQAEIDALNARYPADAGEPPRFLLLHRPRVWSETQQAWIGWERKRGKLEQLVRRLATGDAEGFLPLAPGASIAPGVRYVVTLDSDTGLPPGALRELVAIAAHPLNAPRFDEAQGRVTAGYGILQPRIVTPLAAPEEDTPFHRMFAGQAGIDPYNSGVSDVYQDLFGTGSFTGKGLLNVAAVHAALDGRLPADSVLSHDLLEGTVARCAYVSDVVLIEDHPRHAGVAASRVHRWTRGDWQLLPLMLRARRFGIDALGLWKMADNLRRSLVVPACVAAVALAAFTDAIGLGIALAMTAAALLAGPLMGSFAGLVPGRGGIGWRHFLRGGVRQLGLSLGAAAWQFTMLAAQARLQADATLRALWRMAASRRGLLEWTTAEQAQGAARQELSAFARHEAPVSIACVVLALLATKGPHPAAGLLVFMLWAFAPVAAWWASRPAAAQAPPLAHDDRAWLEGLARDTWRFFERCVTEEDNHLPPDNLQMVPEPAIAHRTSPTNIGFYLLAVCCARTFGWIATAEMARRLALTLASIERLPRHRGHLLNWYDTRTLEVLPPAYVSTVDSGNFAALLLAVAGACDERAREGEEAEELARLAARCRALSDAMEFRPLYDARRHLFHIGLRVHEHELDAGYYDLMASEARLTSYLAVARGDVPLRNWQALGRPFMFDEGRPGLRSWSGSMFEYLMPSLLMTEPSPGLLARAAVTAVSEHRKFGAGHGVPWGVSESAYFAQDHTLAFQYGPFGVQPLALRRTPAAERVIAPYATLMAAIVAPQAAVANGRALEALGARGEFGLYEAVDFTVSRQPEKRAHSIVETFMAHHQGMALVAMCNVLRGEAPRRWFGADPRVEAHESLMHECLPRQIVRTPQPRPAPEAGAARPVQSFQARDIDPLAATWQPVQLLSNGAYSVALRPNGAGVSRWRGRNLSRWRDDLLRDSHGTFFYLLRADKAPVSLTSTPAPGRGWRYESRYMADRVQFEAGGDGLNTVVTVVVSPEDDAELRFVNVHNESAQPVEVEVVSYFEAVLADPRADDAHPAFTNLFVETAWLPASRAMTLLRKPRLEGDPVVAAAHMLASFEADVRGVDCIADRRALLGRNGEPALPAFGAHRTGEDGSPVNGLDPVACLRVKLAIAPGATARLCYATLAAETMEDLDGRIDQYLQRGQGIRALRMAATLAQVRLRDLTLSPAETAALQDMATALMYAAPRGGAERGAIDQRQLWRFGLSGDKPIVLVRIHSANGVPLVGTLLRAQPWWGFGGLAVDVVVLNSEPNSYLMPLQRDILALRDRMVQAAQRSFPGIDTAGFYLLREQEVSDSEKAALAGLARIQLNADGRALELHVAALKEEWSRGSRPDRAPPSAGAKTAVLPAGGFDAVTGEYRFRLAGGEATPRPWINVIANPRFGFQVSEAGSGYTWAVNSRLHQVTPWSNDAVRDTPSEHWMLRDRATGALLPPVPCAGAPDAARYEVRHGQGYTVVLARLDGLSMETTFFADVQDSAKVVRISVRNEGTSARELSALAMAEWQLGGARHERRTLFTWKADGAGAVFAQQREGRAGFGGGTAFLLLKGAASLPQWTCDRGEFFDVTGRLAWPATFGRRAGHLDPVGALGGDFDVGPGETAVVSFVLGYAPDEAGAQRLAADWEARDTAVALEAVKASWRELLGTVQVRTPDPLFDALLNHWLLYQTVACRMWSKAAFYQAGGASGFRDQLQDSMALAVAAPRRLREQILVNASRQFPEGDVQHWWHAPGGEGVRTHFSDDLLWLPYALAHYVDVTGDEQVLDEQVPFLDGPPIPEGAEDAYYAPARSDATASLYEHCARTIDRSLPTGAHGLPLMGTGDWNDGMNRVGHEGRGESVWLAWFIVKVVEVFAPFAQARGDTARAQRWLAAREGWIAALHGAGWDGEWFRRAFFDNGAPLGSSANEECRIDLIAQAWAVLSGAAEPARAAAAIAAMNRYLVDRDAGLLRLLDPPLEKSANNPGYIQAYPPGVRENGGQYSHGAVWALMAQALSGDTEGAWESFRALSPAHRTADARRAAAYEIEPYVMPGDVYGAPPYVGRGGWSWYTGSAAWLYRAGLETILGLAVRRGALCLAPRVPAHWDGFEIRLRLEGRDITLAWRRDASAAMPSDRELRAGEWLRLDELPAGPTVVAVKSG